MVKSKNLTQYPHIVESIKKPEEDGNDHLDQHLQINRLLFSLQSIIWKWDQEEFGSITQNIEEINSLIKENKQNYNHYLWQLEKELLGIKQDIVAMVALIPKEKPEKPALHYEEIRKWVAICSEWQLRSSRLISHWIWFDWRKSLTQTHEILIKCNHHVEWYVISSPSISNWKMDISITVSWDWIWKAVVEYEVKILSYTID